MGEPLQAVDPVHEAMRKQVKSAVHMMDQVASQFELITDAMREANLRLYVGKLWTCDPETGAIVEPLDEALARADEADVDPVVLMRERTVGYSLSAWSTAYPGHTK